MLKFIENTHPEHIMAIFPHPDDEAAFTGGLFLEARSRGIETSLITLTQGERGQVHTPSNGLSTGELRERELREAAGILEISKLDVRCYPDAGFRETQDEWAAYVSESLHERKPDVVVTYDPSGITGHPDHIALSLAILNIIKREEKPKQPTLLWATLPQSYGAIARDFVNTGTSAYMTVPTHKLNLNGCSDRKEAAIRAHKSQNLMRPPYTKLFERLCKHEWYHEVDLDRDYPFVYVPFPI